MRWRIHQTTYKKRTVDETVVGIYWAYDGPRGLGTPPRLYNQIIREVAMTALNPSTGIVNTDDDNARLFALVNVAMADGYIASFESKYYYNFWRPVTGTREGFTDGNIDTDGDPAWNSFLVTPNFPEWPSAHAVSAGEASGTWKRSR